MAGGTWTSQNKTIPGVYINTKSKGNLSVSTGEKGTVAIAEPLSWGLSGVMQEIIPGDDLRGFIGYDITHEKARFLREMMKGSDTTNGPSRILLYRPKGSGGEKATGTIGGLTITAKYEGVRGNDITVIVQEEPDTEESYEVTTVIDGTVVDEQLVAEVAGLTANLWVEFSGTGSFTESSGQILSGGKDPVIAPADYAGFLTALEPYFFDIVAYDGTDSATIQAFASFVKRISERVGHKCQAVMANASACNSEWVISAGNGVKLEDGTILTPQQMVWWLAGAEAGAQYNQSLTYAQYPGAIEAVPKMNDAQAEQAVKRGEIVFIDSFNTVKVCMDINTLTSFTTDKGQEYAKNRVMRVLNQYCNDAYRQFSLYYIGKMDNNENGRNLVKGWNVGYLNEMQANGGIQNFQSEDVTVNPGNTIDAIRLDAALQPVDSIEKIYVSVTVSVNSAAE